MGNTIEGFSETVEPPISGEPVTKKETESGSMHATRGDRYSTRRIKFAVSSMQGWRATMEDTHILAPMLKIPTSGTEVTVLKDHALFCVFDGHGGNFTSNYASEHFLRIFTSRPEMVEYLSLDPMTRNDVPGVKLLKAALTESFYDVDRELCIQYKQRIELYGTSSSISRGRSRRVKPVGGPENTLDGKDTMRKERFDPTSQRIMIDRSGSTAVMVLLTPSHIICSNAGDSRAILSRGGNAFPLSFDHKPTHATEINRVKEAGGFVRFKRIDGDLAVSRGLGDFRFKLNDNVACDEQKVSIRPEIIVSPRDDENDQFLVLACDGIWDVMSNDDCAGNVQAILDDGEQNLEHICETLLDTCLKRESKDNMTFCLVTLPACEISTS